MAASVAATMGIRDHPHLAEVDETKANYAAHITPQYHIWSRNGHTKGDFTKFEEHNGFKSHYQNSLDRAAGPCDYDAYIDMQCRDHPSSRFVGKMTVARPGEYCDAWTLPRLEQCRKTFGLEAAE